MIEATKEGDMTANLSETALSVPFDEHTLPTEKDRGVPLESTTNKRNEETDEDFGLPVGSWGLDFST